MDRVGWGRDMTIDPVIVASRLDAVRDRIRAAGSDPDEITICAVTKGFGPDAVRAAVDAGLYDIGENYAQELASKADDLAGAVDGVRWHMIGGLQRNKVRRLAPLVSCWQSVDRVQLGDEIARRAPGARVLVQVAAVDHDGEVLEPGKSGVDPEVVPALVGHLRTLELDVAGLMSVGPTDATLDPRPGFDLVTTLADTLDLPVRSMGMSRDLEAAVACGSTMVRLGTALFGPRPRGATASARPDV